MHKRTTPENLWSCKDLHRNMSPAEAKLWQHLRAHRMGDVHFRNQHAIGNYIVDFCAPRRKLIIELDGSHIWNSRNMMMNERNIWKHAAIVSLRFWNNEVFKQYGCCPKDDLECSQRKRRIVSTQNLCNFCNSPSQRPVSGAGEEAGWSCPKKP